MLLSLSLAEAQVLVHEDFERPGRRSLGAALEENRFLEIIDDVGVAGSRGLKANYVGYDRGSERISVRFPLPRNGEEMTLCYDIMFDENFQFVRGGKLLGLGPVNPITGGNPPQSDGWSARINFNQAEGISTYIYEQDKETKWGLIETNRSFRFEKGKYYAISYYVKLNDRARESNGIVKVYVNGELIIEHKDLRFRDTTRRDSRINQFLFSTFHGGSSPESAPKDAEGNYVTVNAYFDNIAIYQGEHIRKAPGPCWQD